MRKDFEKFNQPDDRQKMKDAAVKYVEQHPKLDDLTQGFNIGQKHADCPEMIAIMDEMDKLSARVLEHGKTCKKK